MSTATPSTTPSTTRPAALPPVLQVHLARQAAAPDGPVDLLMMFVAHHAFRRDLEAFAQAATVTPSTDRRTWRALARRWQLFSTVLHHHHAGEDAGLWPLLLERSGPADRRLLEQMEAEHAEIDPLLEACRAGFARLADADDDDARAALAVRLAATREHLGRHLHHEETEALVLVQRLLTQQDWEDLEREHFSSRLPLRETLAAIGWFLHELPPPVVDRLAAQPGTRPLVLLGRLLLSRRFARQERRAFRHLQPTG